MQEELIIMARKKYNELKNNPDSRQEDLDFAEILVDFFGKQDALKQAPKSLVLDSLLFIGYDFDLLNPIYAELMDEINQVYTLVSPEAMEEARQGYK